MERVAFLIEETGERLGCLLNPESLLIQRVAGVQPRQSLGGALSGAGLADDALLYTGGGSTTLQLDLLFDVSLALGAGSASASTHLTPDTEDVRDLTAPLWQLAENQASPTGYGVPPKVRFVWGKSWNIPGVITAVSERLEHFSPGGAPRRSWMRMGFTRVLERPNARPPDPVPGSLNTLTLSADPIADSDLQIHEVIGDAARPDSISQQFYNAPHYWKLICQYNNIADPLHLDAGQQLRLPPQSHIQDSP